MCSTGKLAFMTKSYHTYWKWK